jgi:hypothetical protein
MTGTALALAGELAAVNSITPAQWTPLCYLGQPLADGFDQARAASSAAADAAMASSARAETAAKDRAAVRLDHYQAERAKPRAGAVTPAFGPGPDQPVFTESLAPLPAPIGDLDEREEEAMRRFEGTALERCPCGRFAGHTGWCRPAPWRRGRHPRHREQLA